MSRKGRDIKKMIEEVDIEQYLDFSNIIKIQQEVEVQQKKKRRVKSPKQN
jgi:hypothetical protein